MFDGVLPIGSVVLLKDSTKKLMIMGYAQVAARDPNVVWDYTGCVFPEGFIGPDKMFMFNRDQIDQVFALGYQDQEQMSFKNQVDKALQDLKDKKD